MSEKAAVQAVLPCARALYMFENECLSLCRTLLQGLLADGERLKVEIIQLQSAIGDLKFEILVRKIGESSIRKSQYVSF